MSSVAIDDTRDLERHPPDDACPECGAPQVDGLDCRAQRDVILGWESIDPDLQAEHFLTVATFNVQHPAAFTDEALAALHAGFVDHLDGGVDVATLRVRASAAFEGARRVMRPASERRPSLRRWSATVADVYHRGDPQGAADRVRTWAARVRAEL